MSKHRPPIPPRVHVQQRQPMYGQWRAAASAQGLLVQQEDVGAVALSARRHTPVQACGVSLAFLKALLASLEVGGGMTTLCICPCLCRGPACPKDTHVCPCNTVAPHGARLHACGCTHALACTPPSMAAVSSRQRACLDPRTCARTRTRCCCSCCAGAEPGRPCTEHALGGGQTAVTGRCARARMMLSLHARLAGRSGQRRALHCCELCCGRPHRRQPYGAQHACSSATPPKHLLNLHLSTQARTHAQMHARAQPCPHLHTRALRLLHLLRPPTPRRQLGLLSTHAPPAACSSHTT